MSRPAETPAVAGVAGLAGTYVSTLALTLTNPTTILSFAALSAGLGLGGGDGSPASATAMVLGVCLGSALWWLVLTGGIALVRRRLPRRLLHTVNAGSGLALIAFGVAALTSALTRS